eukprot:2873246-Pleurochrysis_carterae.AAC.2
MLAVAVSWCPAIIVRCMIHDCIRSFPPEIFHRGGCRSIPRKFGRQYRESAGTILSFCPILPAALEEVGVRSASRRKGGYSAEYEDELEREDARLVCAAWRSITSCTESVGSYHLSTERYGDRDVHHFMVDDVSAEEAVLHVEATGGQLEL